MSPSPARTDLSDALRQAFLEELALADASRSEPGPAAFHFDERQGRWFAGDSPPPGAPMVSFEEDGIIVFLGESGSHEHFFPEGDEPESIRAAARDVVQFLHSDYARFFATPREPRSLQRRRAIGALNGGLIGLGLWLLGLLRDAAGRFEPSSSRWRRLLRTYGVWPRWSHKDRQLQVWVRPLEVKTSNQHSIGVAEPS